MATFTESQIPTTGIGTSKDLSSVEENTDQTFKEEPNRNHVAVSKDFEEKKDSVIKEEPDQTEMLTSVEANTKSTEEGKKKVRKKKVKKSGKSKVWRKVQYIGYASISIFCASFVLVMWNINRSDGSKVEDTEEAKNGTGSGSNTCPFWELTGDGYCDDETNIPECGYDYNDCCLLENDRSLCTNCTCHLSEDEVQLFKNQSCVADGHLIKTYNPFVEGFFPELSGPGSHHLGNGVCDLIFNIDKYFFDIGDCCLDEEMKCRFGADYVDCPQDPCIRSNNFCIAEELGDGLCQDYNNGPYCDYDLGDCCKSNDHHLDTSDSKKDCCACFCKTHTYSSLTGGLKDSYKYEK